MNAPAATLIARYPSVECEGETVRLLVASCGHVVEHVSDAGTVRERVHARQPISRLTAMAHYSTAVAHGETVAPFDSDPPHESAAHLRRTTRRAVLRLLTTHPNEVVSLEDVRAEVGEEISKQTVSGQVMSLRRDMPIRTKHGKGYVFLVCVPASGEDRCDRCASHTILGHCREIDTPTPADRWCYGFEKEAT